MSIPFITRNQEGKLQQHLGEWEMFKENLLGLAKNVQELEFIGQLVEDLQHTYDERLEELEDEE